MPQPLMPKATAVWLVDNTSLTFEQVAEFCGLHALEVQGIADGEVAIGIVGLDPVSNGQLTREEIARCEADPAARLELTKLNIPQPRRRTKGARYTPVSKRGDRPNAIAWILKFHPEVPDSQIQKLLGTTKATINAVRDRSHWNSQHIKPQDPVSLGICSQIDLDGIVRTALQRREARMRKEGIEPPPPPPLEGLESGLDDDPLKEADEFQADDVFRDAPRPADDPEEGALSDAELVGLETPEDSREAARTVFSDLDPEADPEADEGSAEEEAESGAMTSDDDRADTGRGSPN